jgi:hypothetical protein
MTQQAKEVFQENCLMWLLSVIQKKQKQLKMPLGKFNKLRNHEVKQRYCKRW